MFRALYYLLRIAFLLLLPVTATSPAASGHRKIYSGIAGGRVGRVWAGIKGKWVSLVIVAVDAGG